MSYKCSDKKKPAKDNNETALPTQGDDSNEEEEHFVFMTTDNEHVSGDSSQ